MKSRDWTDDALAALRTRIKTPDALRAFELLVSYGVDSPNWEAGPGGHGYMKDFRFKAGATSPFSFTCNHGHLLFYVRPAGVRVLRPTLAKLVTQFGDVKERTDGEFTVTVRTEPAAARVVSLLLENWLALNPSKYLDAASSGSKIITDRASASERSANSASQAEENAPSLSRTPWSRLEVEATVADYFAMLLLDLAGQPYNKAAHNRALQKLLSNRSQAAVELKHQNISAVLLELGAVYISGYKLRGNYQRLLQEVVAERIETDRDFATVASQAVEREAPIVQLDDIGGVLVEPPVVRRVEEPGVAREYVRRPTRCDYLEREARNRSLGFAGEQFIVDFEARRLQAGGHTKLSNRVEHVSKTQGDGLGYDVLSFESSGKERLIEVKTTAFGPLTPFYVSRNELKFSEERAAQFVLARVHEFRATPKFFELKGSMKKTLRLQPVTYQARL